MTPTDPSHLPPAPYRDLRAAFAALDEETLARDQQERQAREAERRARDEQVVRTQQQTQSQLAHWVMRERFGLITIGIGCAFTIILSVLPPLSWKWMLYACAFVCVLAGAWQKDLANRRIAKLLPKAGVDHVVAARPRSWREIVLAAKSRMAKRHRL